MKRLRLVADYGCFPIFLENPEPGEDYMVDPRKLPISPELKRDLFKWAAEFDAILNWDDPARSGFPTVSDEVAFHACAHLLVKRLREELLNKYDVADYKK